MHFTKEQNPLKPSTKDYFQLHLVVLIFGFTAILGVLISVHPLSLVFIRTLLASIGIFALIKLQGINFIVKRETFLKMMLTGILITLHWVTFFLSARVSTVAICLAGLSTESLWTSVIEPLITEKKIKALEVFLGLTVILGLYLIFFFEFSHVWGILLGVASAFFGALFSVINGQFTKQHDAKVITFYEMLGAMFSSLLFLGVFKLFSNDDIQILPRGYDLLWLSILAFVCTVYAFSKTVSLAQKFSVFALNLTINLEPVYGIILAFLIFGEKERMTTGFYLGTLVILGSVLAYPILSRLTSNRQIPA